MWLQDFIGELVLQENPTGTTSKTKSTTWEKGFLCFLLKSADDVSVFLVSLDVFGIKKDFCVDTKKRSDIAATPSFLSAKSSKFQFILHFSLFTLHLRQRRNLPFFPSVTRVDDFATFTGIARSTLTAA